MTISSISNIQQAGTEVVQKTAGQGTAQFSPILQFAERNSGINDKEPTEAELKTRMFVDDIMNNLDTSKSKCPPAEIQELLKDLVKVAQQLNGVQKNNLKPQGTPKQNNKYESRLRQDKNRMNTYTELIGSGLSVVQDSKTGLYKLCIGNKLYDIPERKVELKTVDTDFGDEFVPEIVD